MCKSGAILHTDEDVNLEKRNTDRSNNILGNETYDVPRTIGESVHIKQAPVALTISTSTRFSELEWSRFHRRSSNSLSVIHCLLPLTNDTLQETPSRASYD